MIFRVRARSSTFGSVMVATTDPGAALTKARELELDPGLTVTIVDALGSEYVPDEFERLAAPNGLTSAHVALIQGTGDVLVSADGCAADIFYDRLFELAPETRAMFPEDMADQKRKLVATLGSVIQSVTDVDTFGRSLRQLGERHRGYGARREHYGPVGTALLGTLAHLLGPRFTPDVKAAWSALYVRVSEAMIEAGEPADAPTVQAERAGVQP